MSAATTATQLQPMSVPQQYQVTPLNTPLKLPFDEANFAKPRLCRGLCFSATNAWYSKNHFVEDNQCSSLFAVAEETRRLLMPELLHIWATASFWDLGVLGKINLADASLAVELRMSGWPKDENGSEMIDLYPTIWLKTADKVVKAKSPWKEIAAVIKKLRLNSPQNAKIFVEGGGRLSDSNVSVAQEHLTLDQGITFPSGEALYFHVLAKPERSSACGLPCLVTIMKDKTVLEQNISRIGGLITYMLPRQAVTSGHVMAKYFLRSCARDASSDDSAIGMEDSDESDIELVQNYESDDDPEQSLGYINVSELTDWLSVMPSDNINFIIQLAKDTNQTSVWRIDTSRPIAADFALLSDIDGWKRDNYYFDAPAQGAPSGTSTRVKEYVSGYHNDKSLGAREVLILVNQESDNLVGSLQTARIPLIIGGATLWTRKVCLQGPLAPGTSGSWVVDRVSGALCGSIIMVYDGEPYALMITAQALLSDIKTYSNMAVIKTISPTVSMPTRGKGQERQPVVTEEIHKLSPKDDNMGKLDWPSPPGWPRTQPPTPVKQDSESAAPIIPPSAGESRPHYLPLSRNKNFTGRKEVIDELQWLLSTDSYGQRIVLVGSGGVGKTQIALELAHLLNNISQNHQNCSVIWMPALNMASFEYACTEMIKVFNIEHVANKDPRETFKEFFGSKAAGKWFLVIDNVDDMEALYGTDQRARGIAEFIPDCDQGHVLFTTRSHEITFSIEPTRILELPEMDMKDARALLHSSSIQKDQMQVTAMADQLLQQLACLPLAITQASVYMNITKTPIKEYLRLLRNTDRDMIRLLSLGVYGSTDYDTCQGAFLKTWIISFKQICASHQDAATLLLFVACLEPKDIPLAMLPRLGSKQSMTNIIYTLCSYNFFSRRENGEMFDMHSLVHLAALAWNRNEGRETAIQQLAFEHMAGAFLTNIWENEVWRQYMPHALRLLRCLDSNRSEEACHLGYSVVLCLRVDGKTRQAVELLEQVVSIENKLPENHLDRLAAHHNHALTYKDDGQIKDSIQLLENIVAVQNTTLAENHPNRLGSQYELALAYKNNGQIKDAIELLEHVVLVQKTTLAKGHIDQLGSQHELALAYKDNGQVGDAIGLLEYVIAVGKETLAEHHPDLLASQHALAIAYGDSGLLEHAVRLLKHVVAVQKKRFAKDDRQRLASEEALEYYLQHSTKPWYKGWLPKK